MAPKKSKWWRLQEAEGNLKIHTAARPAVPVTAFTFPYILKIFLLKNKELCGKKSKVI